MVQFEHFALKQRGDAFGRQWGAGNGEWVWRFNFNASSNWIGLVDLGHWGFAGVAQSSKHLKRAIRPEGFSGQRLKVQDQLLLGQCSFKQWP